ncbi:MAG: retropepsin-like aspartic protease [Ktedonobacterales bacterium]
MTSITSAQNGTNRLGRSHMARRRQALLMCIALALCLAPLSLAGCQIATTTPASAKGTSAPAQIQHGESGAILVIVQLTIAGRGPYPFALDTGASISLIDRSLAQRLGLADAGPVEHISGIGGSEQVIPVQVKDWSLGSIKLPNVAISSGPITNLSSDGNIDGLLGSDVLSHFGAITIDYNAGTVTVYQQAS